MNEPTAIEAAIPRNAFPAMALEGWSHSSRTTNPRPARRLAGSRRRMLRQRARCSLPQTGDAGSFARSPRIGRSFSRLDANLSPLSYPSACANASSQIEQSPAPWQASAPWGRVDNNLPICRIGQPRVPRGSVSGTRTAGHGRNSRVRRTEPRGTQTVEKPGGCSRPLINDQSAAHNVAAGYRSFPSRSSCRRCPASRARFRGRRRSRRRRKAGRRRGCS